MLKRKIYNEIVFWKETKTKQALLVTGARQVGKTYIVREFAGEHYENFIEINLIDNSEARESFIDAKNSADLFMRISVEARRKLIPGKTLIFIDEVQEAKEVVTFIKFLVENGDFDYVLSGSMLGVELRDIRSVPVGYLHTLEMFPLDFEEFCWANGIDDAVYEQIDLHFKSETPVPDYLHKRLLSLYHQYLIVGGMPEPVFQFVETGNIQAVRSFQRNIIRQYRKDIARYSTLSDGAVIKRIYDLIPGELNRQNKRFIIKNIDGKSKYSRNENRFLWIVDAGVALAAYNVREPRHPLLLSLESSYFKLFLSDVGLLTCLCGMDVVRDVLADRVSVNYGALYENAVAQELTAHGHRLFYFKNQKMGEIDFVVERNDATVIPIEVKSGKKYKRHKALNNVLGAANYGIQKAYVFHEKNISAAPKITYFPIYMISRI